VARDHRSAIQSGHKVLIAAHGNSLRRAVKYLDNVPRRRSWSSTSTGMPLVYELDDELHPLNRYYLGDPAK